MPDIRPAPDLPRFSRLLRLAGPIVLAQMAFFGMQTTDTIIAGQLGADVLAAVALGGTLLMLGFTFLLGFALAVAPGVAQRFGGGEGARDIGRYVSSSLALSVALWTVWGGLLWVLPDLIFAHLSLEPQVREAASGYLRAVSLGTPFLGVFFTLRNTMEALGHSRPIMWLGFAGLLINIPLDLALMHGWGPLPALGAVGCGLATALVDVGLALGMIWLFLSWPEFRPYRAQGRPSRAGMGELWRLGLPLALALVSECAIFAVGGLLMTRFGTATLGASQIALNFAGMMFMIALGLGQATAVLVGQAAGARDPAAVRRAGRLGYQTAAVLALGIAAFMLLLPEWIIGWYTQDAAVAATAVVFLKIAGAFHIFDALQAVGSGALRGLKDTRFVMWATTAAYWGLGGSCFAYLFFYRSAGAAAIWWIYTVALALAAGLLGLRFWRQTNQSEVKFL